MVRAFRAWSGGARITEASLLAVAAEVWECSPSEVVRRAAARGLHSSQGFSPGFRGAFELIAAAQRLPVPVNDYPTLRERLRSAALSYPLELPVVGTRTVAR